MRSQASILHLDLDSFYASVEQRDKPSLKGKPVIVGGVGQRGVVATASYEARVFGVRSAMSMGEARRRAPHAAVLSGRFDAYRQSSRIVGDLLRELSPVVEPLSLDEAYVDLAAGGIDCSSVAALENLVTELRAAVVERTEGLTASVGVGTSKFMAKLGSEAGKPNGQRIIAPGDELGLITPLPVRAVPGIGPATTEKLARLGIATIADLQKASERELKHELGVAVGTMLRELAFARDDRPVSAEREAKSISVEDTFSDDIVDREIVEAHLDRDAAVVASRLTKAGLFARTITIKVRMADFTTYSRSRTLDGATDRPERIASVARALLAADGLDVREGVRLLGVGVANFTASAQEELFFEDDAAGPLTSEISMGVPTAGVRRRGSDEWLPGAEVTHDEFGRGWVWGAGKGVVTVRFETRHTGVGPVRSIKADDERLRRAELLPMEWAPPTPVE